MASLTSIPPFLLPRGLPKSTTNLLPARNVLSRRTPSSSGSSSSTSTSTSSRFASTTTPSDKHRVLEKPDKFRPPSHPARHVKRGRVVDPINYPGPRLSAKELEEKRTKKYPHMFPPEGTVMYRFLTNRGIHVWISLSVLVSLATFTFTTNFKATSPFAHLLPPWSHLLTHPIDTVSQVLTVLKMHSEHTTQQTAERRKRNLEDVEKRKAYRRAHGLEKGEEPNEGITAASAAVVPTEGQAPGQTQGGTGTGEEEYVDFERRRRPIKKWFGIW